MEVIGFSRGRSSILFKLKSTTTGLEYPVFVSGIYSILKNCSINKRFVTAEWTVSKKGANFALILNE